MRKDRHRADRDLGKVKTDSNTSSASDEGGPKTQCAWMPILGTLFKLCRSDKGFGNALAYSSLDTTHVISNLSAPPISLGFCSEDAKTFILTAVASIATMRNFRHQSPTDTHQYDEPN